MTRPSFQFYPKDWFGNAKLGRCSLAARGAWMAVLCVLHDSEEYGVARYPLAELAGAAYVPLKLLRELVDKGVLKGCDTGVCEAFVYRPRSGRREGAPVTLVAAQAGPIWYSSRLVKDEYVRTLRADAGWSGDGSGEPDRPPKRAPNPTPKGAPKVSPKGGFGEGSDPRDSSSSSSMNNSVADGHPARARAWPPPEPPDPELEGHARTPAGEACRAIRDAGIADVNPGHPDLLRLLQAGVPVADMGAAARELAGKGKARFALLLATLEGRLRDAAAKGALPDAVPQAASTAQQAVAATQAYLAEQEALAVQARSAQNHEARRAVMAKLGREVGPVKAGACDGGLLQ